MRTETSFAAMRSTDLLWMRQLDLTFTVYEPGDEALLPVEAQVTPSRSLSILDFRARFTDPELAAITSSTDAGVKVLLLKLTTRTDVDLDDPQVIAGMGLLVARGLLTGARRDAILA